MPDLTRVPGTGTLKLKMKFNFIIATPLASILMALGLSGFARATTAAEALDGGDAQRLVTLLDYISTDYAGAIQDGRIVSELEYKEQVRFAADMLAIGNRLLESHAPDVRERNVLGGLRELERQVLAKVDPSEVAHTCRRTRDEVVTRFRLKTAPTRRPLLTEAQRLYTDSCAICHGESGDAQTPRAQVLDPRPASFRDPERLAVLSPYRVYNTLTFGIPGTAMASFDTLTREERWDLAFYVFRLGHAGRPVAASANLTIQELAFRTDGEIQKALEANGHPYPGPSVSFARRTTPFAPASEHAAIQRTREHVRRVLETFLTGDSVRADRRAIDTYLQDFEPIEPRLRARDPEATRAAEASFQDLRAAVAANDEAEVRRATGNLDRHLGELARGPSVPLLPTLAAFLIYLREGIEAALLVGLLLAGLRRLGRPEEARYLHLGWLSALPAGVATWWLFQQLVNLGADRREFVEALVSLTAATVLFWVSFWLISRAEARHWVGYLRSNLESSLGRGRSWLLFGVAFLAVYREAAETVLFTQALMLEVPGRELEVWAGATAGFAAAALAALVLRSTVSRLPQAAFFTVTGFMLCGLSISFAGAGMHTLVAAGYLPSHPVPFVKFPSLGIHPDLTGLMVQLAILLVVGAAGFFTLRRRMGAVTSGEPLES